MQSYENEQVLFEQHIQQLTALYEQLCARHGFDSIFVVAGTPVYPHMDDHPLPFRPSPYFVHWVPLDRHPHCFIRFKSGIKPLLGFYQPRDFWHKVATLPETHWVKQFDVAVLTKQPIDASAFIHEQEKVCFIGPQSDAKSFDGVGQITVNPQALLDDVDKFRIQKSAYEIACLREANVVGLRGHQVAKTLFYEGASCYDIHWAYLQTCKAVDLDMPYHPIIAFNRDAAILHNNDLPRTVLAPSDRHSFLIDAGMKYAGYGSDITRTYSYRKDDRFADLIAGMESLQLDLIRRLGPGVHFGDVHQACHLGIARLLEAFGLVKMSPESQVELGVTQIFFPHGLGHLLGIHVHDLTGTVARGVCRSTTEKSHAGLLPGTVVTVEPGLYFIDMLLSELQERQQVRASIAWDEIEAFKPYGGIRIEDNIVITHDGIENLTRQAI